MSVKGVDACMRCGGAFLASAAVETVKRALDEAVQDTMDLVEQKTVGRRNGDDDTVTAACPACSNAMRRYRVGPVEVDTCLDHGSWYDRGELFVVRAALLAGAATEEVAVAPLPSSSSPADSSGLELEKQPKRVSRAPPLQPDYSDPNRSAPGGGGVDPAVQAKINALAQHERRVDRRRRHHHQGIALDLVDGVLAMLRVID